MCAGIRDAANLTWKLALVLAGRADDRVLDTYETERRPHVRRVIQLAVQIGRMMVGGGEWTSALRDRLLRLLDQVGWLKNRAMQQGLPPFPRGPLVCGAGAGTLLPPLDAVGPDGALARIDDLVGAGFAVVTAGGEAPPVPGDAERGFWSALDTRFLAAGGPLGEWLAAQGARAALVRPDRVILALGTRADLGAWRTALQAAGVCAVA